MKLSDVMPLVAAVGISGCASGEAKILDEPVEVGENVYTVLDQVVSDCERKNDFYYQQEMCVRNRVGVGKSDGFYISHLEKIDEIRLNYNYDQSLYENQAINVYFTMYSGCLENYKSIDEHREKLCDHAVVKKILDDSELKIRQELIDSSQSNQVMEEVIIYMYFVDRVLSNM